MWWVISETLGVGQGRFIVVSGTAAAIRAKYGTAAHGPYSSQAAAQAAANTPSGGFPGPGISGNPGTAIGQGVKSALSNLVGNYDLGHILLYVGEFLLGVVLIGVGLAKITGTDNFINKAAKTAGMAAIL
jgi:hypothetical protein